MKRIGLALKVAVLSVAVLMLAFGAFVTYLVLENESDNRWQDRVFENGPWGSRSVWVSEDGDLWMISEEREDIGQRIRFDVSIYMKTADGWDEVSMNFTNGMRTVMVGTHEPAEIGISDRAIFTCALSVENGRMVLSEFEETGEREFIKGRQEISLTKYAYEEMIGRLPFPYTPD